MSGTIEVQDVSKDGDIIFEIGSPVTKRLRVCSKVLREASQYFLVLFGHKFREGLDLLARVSDPVVVALPEDGDLAMTDLCMMLHGQNVPELSSADLVAQRLYNLAITIDKYHCAETLTLQIRGMFTGYLARRSLHVKRAARDPADLALSQIVVATYVLNEPACFAMATEQWMQFSYCAVQFAFAGDPEHRLPAGVLLALESKRHEAYQTIIIDLPELVVATSSEDDDYFLGDFMNLMTELFQVRFWPPDVRAVNMSVASFVETIDGCDIMKRLPAALYNHTMTKNDLKELFGRAERCCAGLCLRCAKEGAWDLSEQCSVVEHQLV